MKINTRNLNHSNSVLGRLLPKRLSDFCRRAIWMLRLTSNPWQAFNTIRKIRQDREGIQVITSGPFSIKFRGMDELALYEVLVLQEYAFLKEYLASCKRPKVLDIGAHIGTFAIWTFSINSQAQVLSIEADPQTCCVARRNVKQLSIQGFHWDVLEKAAGSSDNKLLNFLSTGPSMSHRLNADGDVTVRSISLRSLLDDIDPQCQGVDLMKIDIEGGEEDFLCGAPDALNQVKSIVVELHPQLCDIERVFTVLRSKYPNITEVKNRLSSKPLLYCFR